MAAGRRSPDRCPETPELKAAYRYCARVVAEHDENFPVASRLLPRTMRDPVAAVYAFARAADDFADEGSWSREERQHAIDDWLERLHACADGSAPAAQGFTVRGEAAAGTGGAAAQVFLALGDTIRRCDLPVSLFEDLLSAFRQDITTSRYAAWRDLLDYCRRSANPVGRLVLRIAGYRSDALDRASDCLCTALQLTNFWQDLERDWRKGRLYVPAEDWRPCGAREADLDAARLTDAWRCALARAATRTRELFAEGREVCDGVRGRLALELRLTWLGGVRILDRVEAAGFDVFRHRPTLGFRAAPALLWQALTWQRSG